MSVHLAKKIASGRRRRRTDEYGGAASRDEPQKGQHEGKARHANRPDPRARAPKAASSTEPVRVSVHCKCDDEDLRGKRNQHPDADLENRSLFSLIMRSVR